MEIRGQSRALLPSQVVVISHSTLADIIYPLLSVRDLLNLELVCRATRAAIQAWFPTGYNINRHLGQYFDDTVSFRRLQATTGTLISGSNALQFFERVRYHDSDMDLYVTCRHTLTVAKWLEENGYIFQPTARQLGVIYILGPDTEHPLCRIGDGVKISGTIVELYLQTFVFRDGRTSRPARNPEIYGVNGIETVLRFFHKQEPTEGISRRKIDVIVVKPGMSPLACILNFHSTLVMNFIAYDTAYSLFPSATFLHRTCLTFGLTRNGVMCDDVHAKYWQRGFRISALPLPVEPRESPSPSNPDEFIDQETGICFGERFVGDKHVWRIPLDTENILSKDEAARASLHSKCLRSNGFNLLSRDIIPVNTIYRNPGRNYYTSDANHPVLLFNIIGSKALETMFVLPVRRYTDIREFLDAQEKLEEHFLRYLLTTREGREENNMETQKRYWDADVLKMVQKVLSKKPERLLSPGIHPFLAFGGLSLD